MRRRQRTKRIGFFGVEHGCGTTHSAFVLCSYLKKCENKRVAYVECNRENEIQYLGSDHFCLKKKERCEMFRYAKIDLYQMYSLYEIECMNDKSYDYIVFDFGTQSLEFEEFLRCDVSFLAASSTVLKHHKLQLFLEELPTGFDLSGVHYLLTFAQENEEITIEKTDPEKVHCIYFNPDPFCPSPQNITTFRNIVSE